MARYDLSTVASSGKTESSSALGPGVRLTFNLQLSAGLEESQDDVRNKSLVDYSIGSVFFTKE